MAKTLIEVCGCGCNTIIFLFNSRIFPINLGQPAPTMVLIFYLFRKHLWG